MTVESATQLGWQFTCLFERKTTSFSCLAGITAFDGPLLFHNEPTFWRSCLSFCSEQDQGQPVFGLVDAVLGPPAGDGCCEGRRLEAGCRWGKLSLLCGHWGCWLWEDAGAPAACIVCASIPSELIQQYFHSCIYFFTG